MLVTTTAYADAVTDIEASFEQNFIRQLPGDYLVPLVAPSRHGIKLCAVGSNDFTQYLLERFFKLLNEISLGDSSVHYAGHSRECLSHTTAIIQFSAETPEKDFLSLLDESVTVFGFEMGSESYPRWTVWEGSRTAFQLSDSLDLYSLTVVRTSVPEEVLRAFTVKAMFQLATTSQTVEWAGPFFSISQVYEPQVPSRLLYAADETRFSIEDYGKSNAIGLCWSDLVNMAFLGQDMSDGATPSLAQEEIQKESEKIGARLRALRIPQSYADLLDQRCIR